MTNYEAPLARVHDDGFLKYAEAAAEVVIDFLAKRPTKPAQVVDLGCGSGRLVELLQHAGHRGLGVDISPDMIELAKSRVPNGHFQVASVFEVDFPECNCVTAVGEVFNYMFDQQNDKTRISELFGRIHEALVPGGLFLFDFAIQGRLAGLPTRQQIFETENWSLFVDSTEEGQSLQRRCVMFAKKGETYRRHEEVHLLKLLRTEDIIGQLESTGFHVLPDNRYNEVELPSGMVNVFCTKKAGR